MHHDSSPLRVLQPSRSLLIVSGVVALHVGALYALQNVLQQRTVDVLVPVEMIGQHIIELPTSTQTPAPKPEARRMPPAEQKTVSAPPSPATEPQPVATRDAPAATPDSGASTQPSIAAPAATAAASSAATIAAQDTAPTSAAVQLPRSDADYLRNPPPTYPRISRSLGEQGRVMVRVLVHANGMPDSTRIELRISSGFERLDAAALAAVKGWRFKPGTRGTVPEAMWVNVPVNFTLD